MLEDADEDEEEEVDEDDEEEVDEDEEEEVDEEEEEVPGVSVTPDCFGRSGESQTELFSSKLSISVLASTTKL